MRILVTGSAGFVGKELVAKLQSSWHFVIGIDINAENQSDIFFQHDLITAFTNSIDFDLCIHLASSVWGILFNTEKADIINYNNLINKFTLKILQDHNCDRMIFFSSINVFEWKHEFPHRKLLGLDQHSSYALSKAMSEMFFSSWIDNLIVIRPTNIFWKSQIKSHLKFGESHVIPDLLIKIDRASEGIEVFGDGKQIRNFLHVDDIIDFLLAILALEWQHFFNLRSSILISIGDLAEELIRFSKKNLSIHYLPEFMKYEQMNIENFDLEIPRTLWFSPSVDSIAYWLSI